MNIKFSIKTKIFFVIIIPALILLFVIYLDYGNLSSLGRSAELILSKNYKSIQTVQKIRQRLEAKQNQVLTTMFQNRKMGRQDPKSNWNIIALLNICKDNITEKGEKQIVDNLFINYKKYDSVFYALLNNNDATIRPNKFYYEFISLTALLISDLNDLILINEKAMEIAEQETKQMARQALRYSMSLLVFAILFTLIFGYILSSRISSPLIKLARSLAIIKEGGGSYPRISVATRDEIGFLTSEFNQLFKRLKAYDQLNADRLTAEKLKVRRVKEAKARFVADLSHQLKTPMTSLSMSIGILHEKANRLTKEKRVKLLETAKEDCERLSALVNELVEIAKVDVMLKPRTKEVLNIEKVVYECLRPLLCQAEEKNINIQTEIEADLPHIAIDSLRFPWVITNLVGNAIRYTDRGGQVVIRAEKRGEIFYFKCIDKGAGIEEKFLPKIFDRFTQFSEREKSGSIGLGLAIVKEIIEQHGGDVKVESKLGKGTTFTFWIPIHSEDSDEKSINY
ncbi:MAG: HAMP domain-containing sensor histidine kinase [Desulfobacterales bacterium]|nr:HAMP domain-containing sensor histidine kinase [Desulfobacterales bacterium]